MGNTQKEETQVERRSGGVQETTGPTRQEIERQNMELRKFHSRSGRVKDSVEETND